MAFAWKMNSDILSVMAQSVRTSRSSFTSSNGYETPSHYSATSNGDDYDSDGSNFALPTLMTLSNSMPPELAGAIPLIEKFQVLLDSLGRTRNSSIVSSCGHKCIRLTGSDQLSNGRRELAISMKDTLRNLFLKGC